jgi:exopolysaccharide production protein ExoQ
MFPSASSKAARRIPIPLELGLDAAGLLFFPVLVLVPHGIAALVSIAGALAFGLALPNGLAALRTVQVPALLLGALLVWATASAAWSVDPRHSLLIAGRLAGLLAAGFALTMASAVILNPGRLLLCFYSGLAVALLLAPIQFATDGLLTRPLMTRGFFAPQLNQAADTLAIMVLPVSAALVQRGRVVLGSLLAAVTLMVISSLVGSAAKTALGAGILISPLLYIWPRAAARAAAIVSVLIIISAPLTFARVARLEAVTETAEGIKFSAWHRLMIWSFAGDRIAERPLTGWGLDASRTIPGGDEPIYQGRVWLPLHPHNAPIQLWLELGVPGAVLFALFLAWLWSGLAATPWPRLFTAAAGASLTSAVIAAMGAYGIWQEWWIGTLWFSLFVILAMARWISDRSTTARSGRPAVECGRSPKPLAR